MMKRFLVAALTVVLVSVPTAAHADYGIDCDTETIWDQSEDGTITHYAALGYEVDENCGHLPTIVWSDDVISNFVFIVYPDGAVEYYTTAEPVTPEPVDEPVSEPAPVVTETPAPVVVEKILGKQ